jgi:hypothetical protein
VGGNVNGVKPSGSQDALITPVRNLRGLQAGGCSLIDTNTEWKWYGYRQNTESLLRKTFRENRAEYSTSSETVDETHFKPGGTVKSVLGKWANLDLDSGSDPTGCGRWSQGCLGKGQNKLAIVSVYCVEKHSALGDATASAQ